VWVGLACLFYLTNNNGNVSFLSQNRGVVTASNFWSILAQNGVACWDNAKPLIRLNMIVVATQAMCKNVHIVCGLILRLARSSLLGIVGGSCACYVCRYAGES
jgi:hypothetical protein